jgi:hypothetical protein
MMFRWDEMIRLMAGFQSAVLTASETDGFPCSVRCQPEPDAAAQRVRVRIPPDATLQPGPASLLWHSHSELLWHQKSFLVRGTLAQDAQGWHLQPARLIPGVGFGGARGMVRFAREARHTADRYLAARHLARPPVPWDEIIAVKKAAKRARNDDSSRRR